MKEIKLAEITVGNMTVSEIETLMKPVNRHGDHMIIAENKYFYRWSYGSPKGYWSHNPWIGKVQLIAVDFEEPGRIKHLDLTGRIAELGLIPPPQNVIPAIITQTDNAEIFRELSKLSPHNNIHTCLVATSKNTIINSNSFNGGTEAPPSWSTWDLEWNSSSRLCISKSEIFAGGLKTPWNYPHDLVSSYGPIFLCIRKIN